VSIVDCSVILIYPRHPASRFYCACGRQSIISPEWVLTAPSALSRFLLPMCMYHGVDSLFQFLIFNPKASSTELAVFPTRSESSFVCSLILYSALLLSLQNGSYTPQPFPQPRPFLHCCKEAYSIPVPFPLDQSRTRAAVSYEASLLSCVQKEERAGCFSLVMRLLCRKRITELMVTKRVSAGVPSSSQEAHPVSVPFSLSLGRLQRSLSLPACFRAYRKKRELVVPRCFSLNVSVPFS
jgi:hypothetical protein